MGAETNTIRNPNRNEGEPGDGKYEITIKESIQF